MRSRALDQALHLLRMPKFARTLRSLPLPDDVGILLHILARDSHAEVAAQRNSGMPAETVRMAAEFYANEILLAPDATNYRVLGTEPGAPRDLLRANMCLLIRWLHPDASRTSNDDIRFGRVMQAWTVLRSDALRANYENNLHGRATVQTGPTSAKRSLTLAAGHVHRNPFLVRSRVSGRVRRWRRIVFIGFILLLLGLAVLAQIGWFIDWDGRSLALSESWFSGMVMLATASPGRSASKEWIYEE